MMMMTNANDDADDDDNFFDIFTFYDNKSLIGIRLEDVDSS